MGGAQAPSGGATYRVLRELGARVQHTHAAVRDTRELVVVQRFQRVPKGKGKDYDAGIAPEAMKALAADACALAKNFHPNVARVRHVDLIEDEMVIATDLVDGATLADLLDAADTRQETFGLPLVVRVLVDVLGGLHGLHGLRDGTTSLGTIHGALCPTNVVVGKDGVARIVAPFRPRPVSVGAGSEALGYAAPEALDLSGGADARADLYAVGVILWEALAGKRLFDEKHPGRVLQRQREEELARPNVAEVTGFAKLVDVAMRAIAFDPALRFRSASELATELRRVAGTKLAPGGVVAQKVMDLAGDKIRARRAELDTAAFGPRPARSSREMAAVSVPTEDADRPTALPGDLKTSATPAPPAATDFSAEQPTERNVKKDPPKAAPPVPKPKPPPVRAVPPKPTPPPPPVKASGLFSPKKEAPPESGRAIKVPADRESGRVVTAPPAATEEAPRESGPVFSPAPESAPRLAIDFASEAIPKPVEHPSPLAPPSDPVVPAAAESGPRVTSDDDEPTRARPTPTPAGEVVPMPAERRKLKPIVVAVVALAGVVAVSGLVVSAVRGQRDATAATATASASTTASVITTADPAPPPPETASAAPPSEPTPAKTESPPATAAQPQQAPPVFYPPKKKRAYEPNGI
jgi:serine/threonine-protein kinase